jgi:hypothetical protein
MPYKVLNVEGLISLMKDIQGDRTPAQFARDLGISRQYLGDIYHHRKLPGNSTFLSSLNVSTAYVIPEEHFDAKEQESTEEVGEKKQGSR